MGQLTKLMYGLETDCSQSLFGLVNNQVRSDAAIKNAGWFNIAGERLGRGDLSLNDMKKISQSLLDKEAFLVLSEMAAFWNLPNELDAVAPGIKYVVDNCSWLIVAGDILKIGVDHMPITNNPNRIIVSKIPRALAHVVIHNTKHKINDVEKTPTVPYPVVAKTITVVPWNPWGPVKLNSKSSIP